jgi:cytochrome d oxidase subunit CydB
MHTFWFCAVALMIAAYVILDGFDLGAGIIHLFVARTDEERRRVLESIGPFWDGNEVWLLAGGGTLYFAFPALYSASFSGFYLPLMVVLWLLMLRGIAAVVGCGVLRGERVARDIFWGGVGECGARGSAGGYWVFLFTAVD